MTDAPRHDPRSNADGLIQPATPLARPGPPTPPFPHHTSPITSFQHPTIQRISQLRQRAIREQTSLYYIEGLRFVFQALRHNASVEALVVCRPLLAHTFGPRLVREVRQRGVPIVEVTAPVMRQLALASDPQGIGAVVRQRWEPLERLLPGDELCWIALHLVRSAGNLGTILRTSDAVGGAGVMLLGDEIDPYAPAAVRATMGALYTQRLVRTTSRALRRWCARHGGTIAGTSPVATTDYRAIAYRAPTILLMGEERKGLPAPLQSLCDHLVRIPMVGDSDSLNLGVATGVMLYEVFNQRRTMGTRRACDAEDSPRCSKLL